mmetsp:Transcript_6011/g.8755  ORF Transcript_6011/g.8755 Transcript_6011/m.8755 type:complete len:290 (-) Transcript_6011:13-882(-)|eukprot:CAMPEP_0184867792 /NCGR_PEP_ID=MMETSP0580-20130426/27723_1 /TAXON_ID=1118495 /ORGANISM="Dactyliosolen fragilissimus" /LENGTH=289 /DNA_ID=CAMNT_0027368249 /DNA_START=53 /DNA_END=922 /DNA_ORIENTATION=+
MGSSLSTNNKENWTIQGKNVLITGASSGIGAELTRYFAQEGASIALIARNVESLNTIAKEAKTLGSPRVEIYPCDLTKDSNIETAITSAINTFNTFDVVILNAGQSMGSYFEEIKDVDSINYMLKLNVNGVIHTLFYALPSIPKVSSSRIVIISSVSGIMGVPYRTIYCASKHALVGFANSLRIELKDTYGPLNAPTVQLVNFPEVKGTNLNEGRMNFGADRPPIQFMTDSNVPSVQMACSGLVEQIKLGTEEWGQPLKVKLLLPLRHIFPTFIDALILKTVKKTHYRP